MQCHCRAPCQTNESSWPGRHAARSRAQALQGSNATLTKRTPGPKSWCEKPRVRSGYIYDIYISCFDMSVLFYPWLGWWSKRTHLFDGSNHQPGGNACAWTSPPNLCLPQRRKSMLDDVLHGPVLPDSFPWRNTSDAICQSTQSVLGLWLIEKENRS